MANRKSKDDHIDESYEEITSNFKRTHSEIIQRSRFPKSRNIDARVSSTRSLFDVDEEYGRENQSDENSSAAGDQAELSQKTFPVMLKLIKGSMGGGTE